jgi:hypothetical protein
MEWTIRYYIHQAEVWKERRHVSDDQRNPGAAAYAARKSRMWSDVAEAAEKKFLSVNSSYVPVINI